MSISNQKLFYIPMLSVIFMAMLFYQSLGGNSFILNCYLSVRGLLSVQQSRIMLVVEVLVHFDCYLTKVS